MIELKFENVDELIKEYITKINNLKNNVELFENENELDIFVDAYMDEVKFYKKQIEDKRALKHKFDKKIIKLMEKSEELKFDFNRKKEKYSNYRQRLMNKKLFKIFKNECKLACKQGLDYEQKFFDEKNKEFKDSKQAEKQQEKQERQNAKENAKQGVKVEAAKNKPLLEHKEDKQ